METIQLYPKDRVRVRNEILAEQGGICPVCEKEILEPCLDHEHVKRIGGSGKVRGVLCRECNSYLGKIENYCRRFKIPISSLPSILANISTYLAKEPYPYIHPNERPMPMRVTKSSYLKMLQWHKVNTRKKVPDLPRGGNLTKALEDLFLDSGIDPTYYSPKTRIKRVKR